MRLQITYHDQNDGFGRLLPRTGVVESTPACSDDAHRWFLIRLDAPIEYEGVAYSHFLVASRWRGRDVGEPEPTSVFLLLVPASHGPVGDGFSPKEFPFVAWGMARILA